MRANQPAVTLAITLYLVKCLVMEGSILALLERHGALAYEVIAGLLGEQRDAVRNTLIQLRDRGLIRAVTIGDADGNRTNAASSWSLTDAGRAALAESRYA